MKPWVDAAVGGQLREGDARVVRDARLYRCGSGEVREKIGR
jgi:hypothetical protein